MADEQKPVRNRRPAEEPSRSVPRPREKYPAIPIPQRRSSRRPEIYPGTSEHAPWWKRLLVGVAWLIVLVMAAGAALRVFLHDWWIPLVWWNAFTLYVYLPAYLCLVVAVAFRRWRLAAVATAVIVCHLLWIAPDFVPRGGSAWVGAAEPSGAGNPARGNLRLYYQNVNMYADDYGGRIDEILASEPDVITLVEFMPAWEQAFGESRIAELYPYNTIRKGPISQKIVLFSKQPLEDVEYRNIGTGRLVIAATVLIADEPVRVFCIHVPRPVTVQAEKYFEFSRSLIEWVDRTELPCVVVGDFNSTQHARWYGRLLDVADLHCAHREVGRGYAVSWPNGRMPFPPIRIDHVLLSSELICRSIREGDGGESDHKPLICEIALASVANVPRPPAEASTDGGG